MKTKACLLAWSCGFDELRGEREIAAADAALPAVARHIKISLKIRAARHTTLHTECMRPVG
jgi:hypothetical protein